MTWLWIPILVMWGVMMINGYQKGFLKIVISFVLSVLLILTLSPVIETILMEKTPMLQQIEEFLQNVAASAFGAETENSLNQQIAFIHQLPILEVVKDDLIENNNDVIYQMFQASSFMEYITGYVARFILKMVAFLLALLATNIILRVVEELLELFDKLPIMGWANHLGGMVLGFCKGIIYLWIFFAILSLFSQTAVGIMIMNEVTDDAYLNFLYQNNFLIQYLVAMVTAGN